MTPAEGLIIAGFAVLLAVVFGLWLLAMTASRSRPTFTGTSITIGDQEIPVGAAIQIGGLWYRVVKQSDHTVTVEPIMDVVHGVSVPRRGREL